MSNFSITGEFITQHARNLWYEGDFGGCLKFLDETVPEMGLEYKIKLIEGVGKLTGKNEVDWEEDSWPMPKEDYPKFYDMLKNIQVGYKLYCEELDRQREEAIHIIEEFRYPPICCGYENKGRMLNEIRKFNGLYPEAKTGLKFPHMMIEWAKALQCNIVGDVIANYEIYHAEMDEVSKEIIQEIKKGIKEVEERKNGKLKENFSDDTWKYIIKIDRKMECEFGWLMPDGEYYVCEWCQHRRLADALFPHAENADIVMMRIGAIKICEDDYREFHIFFGDRKPTEEQDNMIYLYCENHGKDYGEYEKEKERIYGN